MKVILKLLSFLGPLFALALIIVLPAPVQAQPGKYGLTLWVVPGEYPNKVKPDQENHLFLNVQNNSNLAVTSLRFSSDAPDKWSVVFDPASLDTLVSGSTYTVDVNITPPSSAEKGDHSVTFIATANETRAVTSISLRVEGTSYWLWVGLGLAGLVIAVFIIIYLRFGRK